MSFFNIATKYYLANDTDNTMLTELVKQKGCSTIKEGELVIEACSESIEKLDQLEADQNEYVISMEKENLKIKEFQEEKVDELRELYNEIKKLEDKRARGTITEDEEKELESKSAELNSRGKAADAEIDAKNSAMAAKNNAFLQEHNANISVYQDLADVAKRDGEKFTKENPRGLLSMMKSIYVKVGELMIAAGKNLQTSIDNHTKLNNTIQTANKVKTPEVSDTNAQTSVENAETSSDEKIKKEEI